MDAFEIDSSPATQFIGYLVPMNLDYDELFYV